MFLTASMNLSNRTVASGELNFSGQSGAAYLPKGYSFSNASSQITFNGPFAQLTNNGTLLVTNLLTPQTQSLNVNARWNGRGTEVEAAQGQIDAGGSSLNLAAALASTNNSVVLNISEYSLRTDRNEELKLAQPAQLRLEARDPGRGRNPRPTKRGYRRLIERNPGLIWPVKN